MINLRNGQITNLLNNSMRYNPETISIGYALLQEKRRIMEHVDKTRLMSSVDDLDEKILDYLAVELRTPAYNDSLPLETKRTLIKGTLPFYAKLGTAAAVEWITATLLGNGSVSEWFEYGGNPYCFRINVNLTGRPTTLEELEQAMRGIFLCKNLRSHLDEIQFTIVFPPAELHVGGEVGAVVNMDVTVEEDVFDFRHTLPVGGTVGTDANIVIPKEPDNFDFQASLHAGGTPSSQTTLPMPEDATLPPAVTILRTGGVCTIISNRKGE